MLSALIRTRRGYPAVPRAGQPAHRRSVQHGPLVLVSEPRKSPAPTTDRDRTVSRRSEPSSRATLMGEQPNPWDLLKPACAITLCGRLPIGLSGPLEASVTFLEATTPVKLPTKQCPRITRVRNQMREGQYFNNGSAATGATASQPPDYPTHRAPGHNAKL